MPSHIFTVISYDITTTKQRHGKTVCLFNEICCRLSRGYALRWRHNGGDSVSNHQPRDCLLNRLFRRRSKKTSKLRVTGLCAGNSPGTGEFPAQMASNAENVSIWWRLHGVIVGKVKANTFSQGSLWKLQQKCWDPMKLPRQIILYSNNPRIHIILY